MQSHPVRVAIVSPHPLIHGGLSGMVAKRKDLVEALPSASGELDADVVLYDATELHRRPDFELDYLATLPSAALVVVVPPAQVDLRDHVLNRGAVGVVSFAVNLQQLAEVVLLAALEPPEERRRGPGGVVYPAQLTRREVQVLSRIALGRTNQQIAPELYLSPNSIKTYVRSAYGKIGVNSRSQAVSWMLQDYAVSPSGEFANAGPVRPKV